MYNCSMLTFLLFILALDNVAKYSNILFMITCVILWLITNPTAFSSKLYDDLLCFVTTQLLL